MQIRQWISDIPELIINHSGLLLDGLLLTIEITAIAVGVGIILGTLLALMRLSNSPILKAIARIYVTLFRSIPLLLVLLWFYLVFPQAIKYLFNLPPYADVRVASAIIAFALFEAAYYSEIIRAGIKAIKQGQYQASYALGMTKGQMMRLVILPQAFRAMVPLLLTQGIILFQDTSLVYVMSLIDLFGASVTQIGMAQGGTVKYSMIIFSAICYFVICFSASRLVSYIRKD